MPAGLLPVWMAQLLKRVASWSILQPWRAACFQGIWKICADYRIKSNKMTLKWLLNAQRAAQSVYRAAELSEWWRMMVRWRRGGWRGSTWSSQLTPGYLPDWICSSSHGLSLSRPGCCMLRSELQHRHTSSFTGASGDDTNISVRLRWNHIWCRDTLPPRSSNQRWAWRQC